ncbi:GMC family oxidoreductase [Roseibium sp. RKSG952]|uniref:GMC family oxidoreductase n=1 Tax=Roseibium sp. RKSG952 TaxID=2529384 RepID=UPI0012BB8FC0|nr:GMC family oxidoreductase N-terminal domain-containing protein [Roseibium sp. RKSG952]MTH96495.1 choline dehydrogenase [Roseibium sp. RKSG952]
MDDNSFDYIIAGAGSAGCILAEQLSRDPSIRVLLLEAGGSDRSPWVSLPLGYGKLHTDPNRTWQFLTEPDAGLAGRRIKWPRGRLIGGSGSINAMVYCRGLPSDFDDWAASGAKGWDWHSVKPWFEALETQVSADNTRSGSGPLHVQDVCDQIHPVNRHFFDGLKEIGLPVTGNMNGDDPEGGGIYRINTKDGMRCSSARAYLGTAKKRANLTILTRAHVRRVVIRDGLANGIELTDGRQFTARAEVILAAGAIGSPQILQLSGIGPGEILRDLGLPVLTDNPNVGGNLQDHVGVSYTFEANEPTLNGTLATLPGKAGAAWAYLWNRKGPLSLSVNQCGGFVRSCPKLNRADQQLYFNPVSYRVIAEGSRTKVMIDRFPGFLICAQPTRPTSRGRIDIAGADPAQAPLIRPNSLSTEEDRRAVVAGGRLCQSIMNTQALKRLAKAPAGPDLMSLNDDALLADFRERATTVFHPVSTCRMGVDPESSVTDNRLKVHGVDRLRVIDASAFPNITSGNTNAPTMMLALKGASMVLEDRKRVLS